VWVFPEKGRITSLVKMIVDGGVHSTSLRQAKAGGAICVWARRREEEGSLKGFANKKGKAGTGAPWKKQEDSDQELAWFFLKIFWERWSVLGCCIKSFDRKSSAGASVARVGKRFRRGSPEMPIKTTEVGTLWRPVRAPSKVPVKGHETKKTTSTPDPRLWECRGEGGGREKKRCEGSPERGGMGVKKEIRKRLSQIQVIHSK